MHSRVTKFAIIWRGSACKVFIKIEPALSVLCEQFAEAMRNHSLNRWLIEQKTFWFDCRRWVE